MLKLLGCKSAAQKRTYLPVGWVFASQERLVSSGSLSKVSWQRSTKETNNLPTAKNSSGLSDSESSRAGQIASPSFETDETPFRLAGPVRVDSE